VYEPDEHQTYYVSFGRSATPPGTSIVGSGTALALTTKDLEPEVSTTWEAGAKWAALNGRLAVTASVFTIDKSNAKQTDPATGDVQVQSGQKQRIRGAELGLNGIVTSRWKVYANYSYLDAEITDDLSCATTAPIVCAPSPDIGREVTYTPKHAASVWTTYDLDQVLTGLEVGGGVTYQSDVTLGYTLGGVAGAPNGITKIAKAPETFSLDGYLAYETGRWRIAVNGYNLTDRLNYTQVFSNRAVPSPGRTVVLTLGASF
jgi:catecholate siderophore receptor